MGKKIEVKQAKNCQRPVIIPSGGNQQHNSGGPSNRPVSVNQPSPGTGKIISVYVTIAAFPGGDRSADMYGGQFDPRNDVSVQARGGNGRVMNAPGIRVGGPSANRPGDWCCQSCGRFNFAGRDQCKPCGVRGPVFLLVIE